LSKEIELLSRAMELIDDFKKLLELDDLYIEQLETRLKKYEG
jgi:hypothetical protein